MTALAIIGGLVVATLLGVGAYHVLNRLDPPKSPPPSAPPAAREDDP